MSIYLLIVVVCLLTFSGCGQSARLTFMVGGAPNELAFFESVLASFTLDTGIKVTMIRQSTDSTQRKQGILLALRGNRPDPDVMLLDVAWIGQIAASQWLEPLDGYDIDKNAFFQSVINLADTWQQELIGLPLYIDGGLLYYRKDLLEKYGFNGPPQTWDELVKISQKVMKGERSQNANFWGYVWQGAQYEGLICNALEVFASNRGGFFSDLADPVIDQQANIDGLTLMSDLIHKYSISPPNTFTDMREEEVRQVFHQGNALFQRNWPYAWGLHNADDSPIKGLTAMAPLPGFSSGWGASTLGGWHIVMSKFSDMKAESAELLKYLTSAPVQKELSLKLGWNPGRTELYDDPEILAANPALNDLKAVFENAIPRPIIPYYSSASQILQNHINAALAKRTTPEQALKTAQQNVLRLLKKLGIK